MDEQKELPESWGGLESEQIKVRCSGGERGHLESCGEEAEGGPELPDF